MKFTYLLGAFALTFIFGCSSTTEEKTKVLETKTVETVKEVEAEATVKKEEAKTTIKVGPEGGSVKTSEVEIEINE